MKQKIYKILIVIIFNITSLSISFAQESLYDAGVKARRNQEFQKARTYLEKAIKKHPNDVDIMLNLGLSLISLKKYNEAYDVLIKAQSISPKYDDINIAIINIFNQQEKFNQSIDYFNNHIKTYKYNAKNRLLEANLYLKNGENNKSISLLEEASESYPNDQKIKNKLSQLIKNRNEEKAKNQYWLLYTGYENSKLTRNSQPDWNYSLINLYRKNSKKLGIVLGAEKQQRKERNTDEYFEMGFDYKISDIYWGYITSGTSRDQSISPRYRFKFGGSANIFKNYKFIKNSPITLDIQHDIFPNSRITLAKLGIEYNATKDLIITPQIINILDEDDNYIKGWSVRASLQTPFKKISFKTGISSAPETDSGVTIDTDAWFIGIRYKLTKSITLNAYYTRENREDSYIREIIAVGTSIKF